ISTEKNGQVHFIYKGDKNKLAQFFTVLKPKLIENTAVITGNMKKRGGGISDIELADKTKELDYYYQLHCTFETVDAMGANFINSCLEKFAETLKKEALEFDAFSNEEKDIQVVMSILSNYTPNCIVKAEVSCPAEELNGDKNISPQEFAEKFIRAINIPKIEDRK